MIPVFARLDFNVNFKLLQRQRTYTIDLTPSYGSYEPNNKTLQVFAEYHGYLRDRYLFFDLDPVIETEITLAQTKEFGKWRYIIQRISNYVSTITATYRTVDDGDSRETTLKLNDIPSYMNFELYLTPLAGGGGELIYDSDSMYDIELFIDSFLTGKCRYITLQNMPLSIHAQWTPNILHGEINLTIEGDGTDLILKDDLTSPDIELKFSSLETLDLHATWNLTNPGDVTITKTEDAEVDFEIIIGNWYADFIARADAEKLQIQWLINVTGYVKIDTDWQAISGIEVYIIGPYVGIDTISEFFRAEDFEIHWTLWPPLEWDLTLLGQVDFYDSSIEIFFNGNWYHLWPWTYKG